jgi:peptidoglycan/LPS O-acetylase OafA/YrhL
MLILKRLAIWLLEMSLELLLLSLLPFVLYGYDEHAFGNDLLIFLSGVSFIFFRTGYLLSTAVSRAVWGGKRWWSYPAIGTALFLVHFQILNFSAGGAFEFPDRVRIQAAGACIVFACTFVGGHFLGNWVRDPKGTGT